MVDGMKIGRGETIYEVEVMKGRLLSTHVRCFLEFSENRRYPDSCGCYVKAIESRIFEDFPSESVRMVVL